MRDACIAEKVSLVFVRPYRMKLFTEGKTSKNMASTFQVLALAQASIKAI
jgi:hypothetical protein